MRKPEHSAERETSVDTNRLPLAFHETFSLRRGAISQVANVLAAETDAKVLGSKTKREHLIRENTHLGNNYVKSMPLYARGTGLLDSSYRLTLFGRSALNHDPSLSQPATLWLMHYHLSAPKGPGPAFWHHLVVECFRSGNQLYKSEIPGAIEAFFEGTEHRDLSEKSAKSTANIFTSSYTSTDGFASLGILQTDTTKLRVGYPGAPPPWAFAYALISYWDDVYGDRLSINLDELTRLDGLASLFLMDDSSLDNTLNELQRAGIVDVFRADKPHQLLLLSHDREMVLRKLYGVQ